MNKIKVGAPAPLFEADLAGGSHLRLADLRGHRMVLYFYPKDDTSGCTKEAQAFAEAMPAFQGHGVQIVGVSPDSVASHERFAAKYGLGYRLASDPDHAIAESYGAWVQKSMYGRTYMGIDRSTFLIDADGVIRAVWRKVKVPGHVEAVLASVGG